MRALLQRVKNAKVTIESEVYSRIKYGLLIFLGVEKGDTLNDLEWLSKKIAQLRIFSDDDYKMNLNIQEIKGEVLVVSQFTLFASTKKGNRPGFSNAAEPEEAKKLYMLFISKLQKQLNIEIKTGEFGADMEVELINDGPVTIFMDTKNKE